jgi:hypothetical protein
MLIRQIYGVRIPDTDLFLYFYEHDPEWRIMFEARIGTIVPLDALQEMLGPMLGSYLSLTLQSPIFDTVLDTLSGLIGRQFPGSDMTCHRFSDEQDPEMNFVVGRVLQNTPFLSQTQVPSDVILQVAMIPYWISKTILLLEQFDFLRPFEHSVFLVHDER